MKVKKILFSVAAILIILIYINYSSAGTQVTYCKSIAFHINHIGLKCFKCVSIKEEENLTFHFMLKNQKLYSQNCELGIEDMECAKKYIEDYMENNADNPMNGKKICLHFSTFADEGMSVYNYDYTADTINNCSNKFSYYKTLMADNFSDLKSIDDPYLLDVIVHNIDNCDFATDWNNLYLLSIYTRSISQTQRQTFAELMPQCEIIVK